jgi:phage recombination protein Bet
MNEKALALQGEKAALVPFEFNTEQVELIKKTVAKGCDNNELALFLYTCKRTGLDPLIRQIYAVKRAGTSNQMSIQTGIDGYRLIAERTGNYVPGREPTFKEEGGKIISATAYVKKRVSGEWHEVAATAYFLEYAQIFNGKLGNMWEKMGHVMIAKCAEALALRRAFPAEMAGVYTNEEMAQADVVDVTPPAKRPERASGTQPELTPEQLKAKADAAAAKYKAAGEAEAKNNPPAQPAGSQAPANGGKQAPADLKTAISHITKRNDPNAGGYVTYELDNYMQEGGRWAMRFATKDSTIIETLDAKMNAGEKCAFEYKTVPWSKGGKSGLNYEIVQVVSIQEPAAGEAQPGD